MLSKIPFFKNLSTSASSAASVLSNSLSFDTPNLSLPSHYTGGYLALPTQPSTNPAMPALTHIHLAFESPSITSSDIYAVAVLQTLLGGGGSFSAGGPGKGMYSRLYTNVLNQHGWVESCVAFNHGYSDSGVFGIAASCAPGNVTNMLDVMCRELGALGEETGRLRLQDREVQRAKNQLRSNLLMNLESRMVELEDLGRQVQTHGRKIGVKEMCAKIEAVTMSELRRVAKLVFGGAVKNVGGGSGLPTVVLQEGEGGTGFKGGWAEIQERIHRWGLGVRR
jgi:processing peptidase subunit alpha